MKKYAGIISLIFLLCFSPEKISFGCMNEYRVLLSGEVVFMEEFSLAPFGKYDLSNKADLLLELHKADSLYRLSGKLEDYSDYGVLLTYVGEYRKAKKIFEDIEKKSPGLYATAANLGTVYELLGENDSAYHWIRKGIEIYPDSHEGSEWIHLKILEAKIKTRGNEELLWRTNILSLDFGADEKPVNKNKLDLHDLDNHLNHQLRERMSFIKPKDPVVAQLLFELGNIRAMIKDVKSAMAVYAVAREYGYTSELLEKRERHFERLQAKAYFWNNPGKLFIIFIAGLIGTVFIIIRIRKRLKQKKQHNENS